MAYLQIPTGLREQALPVLTHALCQLLLTGGFPEIGRRAAHIMDIALKLLIPCHLLRFFHQRWKVRAQKLQPPKHPRQLTRLNFTS